MQINFLETKRFFYTQNLCIKLVTHKMLFYMFPVTCMTFKNNYKEKGNNNKKIYDSCCRIREYIKRNEEINDQFNKLC